MFEVGFGEIVLLFIVALLVLGPERLPQVIRTAALWIGRFKRSYQNIRADIEREIGADDIRRQLHNEEVMARLKSSGHELHQELQDIANELKVPASTTSAPDDKLHHDQP